MAKYSLLCTLALLGLGLIQQATSYAVPVFLENGVYEITFEVWNSIQPQTQIFHYAIDPYANYTATTEHGHPVPPKKKQPPASKLLKCTDNEADRLDGQDAELARRMLENWCEAYGIHKRAIILAVHNDVAWYMCSLTYQYRLKKYEVCSRKEVLYSSGRMDEHCGKDAPGSVYLWHLRQYGRTRPGWNICDNWGMDQEPLTRNETIQPKDDDDRI
ncbi:hypothetical protein E4U54_008380 [Claviceps lovelessii]|nr:hypothetical protein E4U54_008380 [Claviceps lovelessii]